MMAISDEDMAATKGFYDYLMLIWGLMLMAEPFENHNTSTAKSVL